MATKMSDLLKEPEAPPATSPPTMANAEVKEVWVQRNIKTQRYDLHFISHDKQFGPLHGAIVYYPLDDAYGEPQRPTSNLSKDAAQCLLDELLSSGLRPSNGDDIGAMKAKDAHLKDMRDICFAFLKTQIDLKQ